MNFDNINGFEDFMNMFNRPSEGENVEGCKDTKGGFQDLDPHIFTMLA